jgi:hypothetical protein
MQTENNGNNAQNKKADRDTYIENVKESDKKHIFYNIQPIGSYKGMGNAGHKYYGEGNKHKTADKEKQSS